MNRSKTLDLLLVQLCYFPGVNCYNFNYSCTKNDIDAKLESNVEREKSVWALGVAQGASIFSTLIIPFLYIFLLSTYIISCLSVFGIPGYCQLPWLLWHSNFSLSPLVVVAMATRFSLSVNKRLEIVFFRGLSLLQNVFLRLTRPPPPYLTLISVVFNSVLLQSDLLAVWLVRTMVL